VLARGVVAAGAALDAPAAEGGAWPVFEPPGAAREAAELDGFWCGPLSPVEPAFAAAAGVVEAVEAAAGRFAAAARFMLASAFATASDPLASAGAEAPPAALPPGSAAAVGAAAARFPPFACTAVTAATLGVDDAAGPPEVAEGRAAVTAPGFAGAPAGTEDRSRKPAARAEVELVAAALPLPASLLECPTRAGPAFAAVAGAAGALDLPV